MKFTPSCAGPLTIFALSLLSATVFAEGTRDDERTMHELIQEFDSAWNTRDAARFSECFTENGEMWFRDHGTCMRGREQIRAAYAFLSDLPPDQTHVTSVDAIRRVAHGVLLVDGMAYITASSPDGRGSVIVARFRGVAVIRKTTRGWRITYLWIWNMDVAAG